MSALSPLRRRTVILCVLFATLAGAGCANTLVMDTGRSLEKGEMSGTFGLAAGGQAGSMLRYPEPGTASQENDAEPSRESIRFPAQPGYQLEWMARFSRGLGAGFQGNLGLTAPTPTGGAGVSAGLKSELPLPDDGPVAAAAVARGAVSVGTPFDLFEENTYSLGTVDLGLILSSHFANDHALYLSPRVRWDYFKHTRKWSEGGFRETPDEEDYRSDSTEGDAFSYSAALGFKIATSPQWAVFLEATLIHTPETDGWRGVGGVGGARFH